MMTVEKMAKVVSEINSGLASSRPQGAEGPSCRPIPTQIQLQCVCVFGPVFV